MLTPLVQSQTRAQCRSPRTVPVFYSAGGEHSVTASVAASMG